MKRYICMLQTLNLIWGQDWILRSLIESNVHINHRMHSQTIDVAHKTIAKRHEKIYLCATNFECNVSTCGMLWKALEAKPCHYPDETVANLETSSIYIVLLPLEWESSFFLYRVSYVVILLYWNLVRQRARYIESDLRPGLDLTKAQLNRMYI